MGGLGLLEIPTQAAALSGKILLWAVHKGDPTNILQNLLQHYIRERSQAAWGVDDYTWLFQDTGSRYENGSRAFQVMCRGWRLSKKHIIAAIPLNTEDWLQLPLWRKHYNHQSLINVDCKTNPRRTLMEAGYEKMEDITHLNGQVMQWEDEPAAQAPLTFKRAYEQMVGNLKQEPTYSTEGRARNEVYLEDGTSARVWLYRPLAHTTMASVLRTAAAVQPEHSYTLRHKILVSEDIVLRPPANLRLRPIIVTENFSAVLRKQVKRQAGSSRGSLEITEQYRWRDGKKIFHSTTAQIRKLRSPADAVHATIEKWKDRAGWNPDMN
jgi:hypothetical protein